MQDLNDKINDGGATSDGQLSATEWNQLPTEIQNIIEALGITLSGADLNQLGKGIAGYVANGNFYTDSGAVDAYVLSVIGSKQSLSEYTEGAEFEFIAGNKNTGASTANIGGLGVLNIKLAGGVTNPSAGQIDPNNKTKVTYRTAPSAHLELDQSGQTNIARFTASGTYTPPAGVKSIDILAVGAGGGGGGINGIGSGYAASSVAGAAGGWGRKVTNQIDGSYAITIGAGGAGGGGAGNGANGGSTTVISTNVSLTATGGGGGTGTTATNATTTTAAPNGGGFSGGDEGGTGESPDCPSIVNGKIAQRSQGATSMLGFGGGNSYHATGGSSNTAGGGGGGCCVQDAVTDYAGGAGGNGDVFIVEHY